jgi:hypothetical protein
MPQFLCVTCCTQFPESTEAPAHCPICEDERQFIADGGQPWTTLDQLRRDHRNEIAAQEPRLTSIETKPAFAVGERAFLLEAAGGNILWDCISLIDDSTIAWIKQRGGLAAIAISHPHYYTTMKLGSGRDIRAFAAGRVHRTPPSELRPFHSSKLFPG